MTPLQEAQEALGTTGVARPVGGGDVCDSFRMSAPDGDLFIKTHAKPPPGLFDIEAEGLEALRKAAEGAVVVPEVVGVGPRFLALAWIERGRGGDAALGRGLAQVHRMTAPTFGWHRDGWIATLPQPNAPTASLADFLVERRLRPLARLLGGRLEALVDRLIPRLEAILPDEHPALIHGDLWGGNWMADRAGRPVLIDPSVHFGCREADLAFSRMFGGFAPAFEDAYAESFPLAPGFDDRADLWNLHPTLVHARLFGGGYGAAAEQILRRFAG